MPQKSRNRKISRAALCAVSGIALVFATSAAVHAEDDGSEGPYKKFFNKMMSNMGLRDPEPGIEYKERPPLVVPPSRDLRAPSTAAAPSANNPDWPTDPDRKRRAAKPKSTDASVMAGAKADGDGGTIERSTQQSGGMWSTFTDLGRNLSGNHTESGQFVGEPTRNALTDPPAGYRTPSPMQPYGILSAKEKKSGEDKQADLVNGQPSAPK